MARKKLAEIRAARREYKAAVADLHRLQRREEKRGVKAETPAFRKANTRADKAANALPWWAR